METKIKSNKFDSIANKMFSGWNNINNRRKHYNGRIWISWRPDYYTIQLKMSTAQGITYEIQVRPVAEVVEFMSGRLSETYEV